VKARLGQNFLSDRHWQQRVAEAIAVRPSDAVIEIGGGRGALTQHMTGAAELIVIELDEQLATELKARFSSKPNVRIVAGDVLELELRELLQAVKGPGDRPPERRRVVGNLPYYITSPILNRLFDAADLLHDAVLMVQREVGDRIVAEPGSSDYGLLSAMVRFNARPERLLRLPPGAFQPAPEVESSLVRLEFARRETELGVTAAEFRAFLEAAFGKKRKQLVNSLLSAGAAEGKSALSDGGEDSRARSMNIRRALGAVGAGERSRAEQLTVEQLAALARILRGR
jgi:16S rRNA (adenine1518-N6/adenine1519-N6)-dimethyltransferase